MPTARKTGTHRPKKNVDSRAKVSAKKRPLITKPRVIGATAALLVLLAGSYALAAAQTIGAYQHRLASGGFVFSGHLEFVGQDFLSPMNTDMDFSGTFDQGSQTSAGTQFIGNWAGHEYSGDARIASGKLYFDLSGPTMPVIRYRQGSYLLPLQSGKWYSANLDESIYNNVCAHTQASSTSAKLELYRTIKQIKLTPSPLVNFWSSLDDQPATHLMGSLSSSQLAGLWNALQKAAPPGCSDPNTLGISSEDLKHVSTHIDVYAGKNDDDLLKITLADKTLGATALLSLKTSHYGQQMPVTTPSDATDLNSLYASLGLH